MIKSFLITAMRSIRKNKVHSFINIFCLALGMACCILMMFWIKNDLEYDSFHKNLDRLYRVETVENTNGQKRYIDLKTSFPVAGALKNEFAEIAGSARILKTGQKILQYNKKIFRENSLAFIDPSFFDLFTFHFIQGDPATAFKDIYSIVLTRSLAEKYFDSLNPLGKMITIDNKFKVMVTAVIEDIPANTHFTQFYSNNSFVPLALQNKYEKPMTGWQESYLVTYVLLNKGADFRQLNEKLTGYLGNKHPSPKKYGYDLMLHPVKHIQLYGINGEETGINTIFIYTAFALIILLIACINYINLATAFSLKRSKEIGIRKVLGTNRKGIIYQFLWESIVLSFAALLLAVIIVTQTFPFFTSLTGKAMELTPSVLISLLPLFVVLALVTAIIAGSYPAFFLSSLKPITVLSGKKDCGKGNWSMRKTLVTVQIVFSTIFIIGTLIGYSQFNFLIKTNIGHNNKNIITINRGTMDREKFYTFKREIQNHPGIVKVGAGGVIPGFSTNFAFRDAKFQGVPLANSPLFHGLYVDYDYFETLHIPLVAGKNFSPRNNNSHGVIINEMAADMLGGKDGIIGKTMTFNDQKRQVVGVVNNFPVWSLKFAMYPIVALHNPERSRLVYIKIDPSLASQVETINYITEKWRQYFPHYPFAHRFLEDLDQQLYLNEIQLLKIFGNLALLAILICCVGIYGMISYFIQGRLREISIRKVLGADLKHLAANISRGLFQSILIASLIAVPLTWILMNSWLRNYAFRINLGVGFFVLGCLISLIFVLIPLLPHIRKMYKLNPVNFLNEE